jgi:hypothetical protein
MVSYKKIINSVFCFILFSCTSSPLWKLDAIGANEKEFNSARLQYAQGNSISPLHFEIIRMGDKVESYLHLSHQHFSKSLTNVHFIFENEKNEEFIPVLEGAMKLKLNSEMTQKIIASLQKGEKVSILVEDFERVLSPELFSKNYEKLLGSAIFFQNPVKGPF